MFWVHFCDLPMDVYNLSTTERLGNAIRRFEAFDSAIEGSGGRKVFGYVSLWILQNRFAVV